MMKKRSMRVVRYYEHGGPEVLRVEEVPLPEPGSGQLRLRTEIVGASFVDTTVRSGTSPLGTGELPGSPHGEVVGVVDGIGAGADRAAMGRRLAALVRADAYADFVVADLNWAAPVPSTVSPDDSTVLAMAAPCAMLSLSIGGLRPGDTVLVHGAAGSTGHLTVQLARPSAQARSSEPRARTPNASCCSHWEPTPQWCWTGTGPRGFEQLLPAAST